MAHSPRASADADTARHLLQPLEFIAAEHDRLRVFCAVLARLADGDPLPNPRAFAVRATVFVATQRRHLEWENGILLPIARRHFTPAQLAALTHRMAERRGLDLPPRF